MYIKLVLMLLISFKITAIPHYYVTAADEKHFVLLLNLIGSIHKNDWDNLEQIAVFDLGFTSKQKQQLQKMQKVQVYDLELVHPDILKPFLTCSSGRMVRGWFAWKPVVIKQALDLFPYVLYLDAGSTVLHAPDNLFKYIQQNGYFLIDTGPHSIIERSTKTVIKKLISNLDPKKQDFLLDQKTLMISPGLQGLSRQIYDTYVLPVYNLAQDLSLFADDGTSPLGFGKSRHDQPIFSIYAYLNNMKIYPEGWASLLIDQKVVLQHIHWDRAHVNHKTVIYQSRWDYNYLGGHAQYLK